MKALTAYLFRHSRLGFAIGAVAGVVSGLAGASLAVLIGHAMTGQGMSGGWPYAFACLVFLLSKTVCDLLLMRSAQATVVRLREDLSRSLLKVPFIKQQAIGAARLNAILTKDTDVIVSASALIPLAFSNGVLALICLGYMAITSGGLFVAIAVLLGVAMAAYGRAERGPRQSLRRVREELDALYAQFGTLVAGAKELQLNARRAAFVVEEGVLPEARKVSASYIQAMTGYVAISNAGLASFYVIIGLVLFGIPALYPDMLPAAAAATVILLYLIRPVGELLAIIPPLRQASIAFARVHSVGTELDDHVRPTSSSEASLVIHAPLTLQLRQVERRTEDGSTVAFNVGPINLTVRSGEILFLTGGNGSGKTTLAMLLLGLYEPDRGAVFVNDQQVTADNVAAYRNQFSAVFADFQLFEHAVAQDDAKFDHAAAEQLRILQMEHKVRVTNGRFSSTQLSSGQRRRLALVSAFLEDRPAYLFDEWAADQDPEFKRIFYTQILHTLRAAGKAVIVISHDEAYFRYADRVIRMEDGTIAGTYARQFDESEETC